MKSTLLAVLAALFLGSVAEAGTMSFPEDAPVASVTFPDDWDSVETDVGVRSFSADSAVAFYLDIADGKSIETVIDGAMTFLKDNGVTVDEATQTSKDGNVSGMTASMISFDGKDESGPATIQIGFIVTGPDKALVFTYWGTKGEEEPHQPEIDAIMTSIKPAG